jgi:hypothetical protein
METLEERLARYKPQRGLDEEQARHFTDHLVRYRSEDAAELLPALLSFWLEGDRFRAEPESAMDLVDLLNVGSFDGTHHLDGERLFGSERFSARSRLALFSEVDSALAALVAEWLAVVVERGGFHEYYLSRTAHALRYWLGRSLRQPGGAAG